MRKRLYCAFNFTPCYRLLKCDIMAQIRTIDGERHNVNETKEELDRMMESPECIETGIITLNWLVTITSWNKGEETDSHHYEPVTFIIRNIMMYY